MFVWFTGNITCDCCVCHSIVTARDPVPDTPTGDAVAISSELLAKYAPSEVDKTRYTEQNDVGLTAGALRMWNEDAGQVRWQLCCFCLFFAFV